MSAPESKTDTHGSLRRSLASHLTIGVAGLATIALIARFLGPVGLGTYVFLLVAAQTAGRITAGVTGAIRKEVKSPDTDSADYYGVGFLLFVLSTAALSITVIVIAGAFPDYVADLGLTLWDVAALAAILSAHGLYKTTYNIYTIDHDTAPIRIGKNTLIFGLHAVALYLGYEVTGLLFAFAGGTFIAGIALMSAIPTTPGTPTWTALLRIFRESFWTIPSAFASNFHHKLDVLVAGTILGVAAVGHYEAALKLVLPGVLIASAVSKGMAADIQGGIQGRFEVNSTVRKAMTYAGVGSTLTLALVAALSTQALTFVYGPEFSDVGLILVLLAVTQVIAAYRTPYHTALRAFGEKRLVFGVRVGAFLTNIPLSIYLTLEYGLIGVVLATLIVEVLTLALYYGFVKQYAKRTVRSSDFIRQFISAGATFAVVAFPTMGGHVEGVRLTAAVVVIGILVYGVVFISLSDNTPRILRDIFD